MRLIKEILIAICALSFGLANVHAQQKPNLWDDVQSIKSYDKIYIPPSNPILFTGSSSIRKWTSMPVMFKDYTVMNRGIGGAVLADLDRYAEDIIVPYHPKQIVLYIGDNDIKIAANGDSVFAAFKRLYYHIRNKLPEVPVVYISIKPSPARKIYFPIAIRSNELTRAFLKTQKNTVFVDVYKPMLDKLGNTRPELFLQDMVHLNEDGYKLWGTLIRPYLLKN